MGRIKQSRNCNHLGKFARKTKEHISLVLKYKKVDEIEQKQVWEGPARIRNTKAASLN